MSDNKIRVLCVDDHAFLAEGLRSKISLEPDMEYVGWLPDATDLVKEAKEREADVVTLDIEMPGPDPFESLAEVQRRAPEVRVIVLSAYIKDSYLDAAVEAGAWGFLSKADDPDTIVSAIRRVAGGKFALGPSVEGRLPVEDIQPGQRTAKRQSRSNLLTNREQQTLRVAIGGVDRVDRGDVDIPLKQTQQRLLDRLEGHLIEAGGLEVVLQERGLHGAAGQRLGGRGHGHRVRRWPAGKVAGGVELGAGRGLGHVERVLGDEGSKVRELIELLEGVG